MDYIKTCGEIFPILLFILLLLLFTLILFGIISSKTLKTGDMAAKIFFPTVFLIGLSYMLILPPLSGPDEVLHFIGAYELSNRILGYDGRNSEGNIIIRKEDEFIVNWPGDNDLTRATVLGQRAERKVYEEIVRDFSEGNSKEGISDGGEQELFGTSEGLEEKISDEQNRKYTEGETLQKPPETIKAAWFFPSLGISLSRILNLSPIKLLFMGRIFNLLFFTVSGYISIRMIPIGKMILLLISLFPETLELVSSYSYDTYLLSLSFLLVSLVLRIYYSEEIKKSQILFLGILAFLIAPLKYIYIELFLICFSLSIKKWRNFKSYILTILLIGLMMGLSVIFISLPEILRYINPDLTTSAPETGFDGLENLTVYHNLSELLRDKTLIFRVMRNTFQILGKEHLGTMTGTWLSAMDRDLGLKSLQEYTLLFLLGIITVTEEKGLKIKDRIIMLLTAVIFTFLLSVSMFLAYTPSDVWYILGIQGRYYLPLLPIFLMAFTGLIRIPMDIYKRLSFGTTAIFIFINAAVLMDSFFIISAR